MEAVWTFKVEVISLKLSERFVSSFGCSRMIEDNTTLL